MHSDNAPQEAKLLAYTSLCRPILEYADIVWDPSVNSKVHHDIEQIQNKAVRFIANIRGRDDSVSVTRERLKLEFLEERRKNHGLCLLTRILQAEEQQNSLLKNHVEAMGNKQPETIVKDLANNPLPVIPTSMCYCMPADNWQSSVNLPLLRQA